MGWAGSTQYCGETSSNANFTFSLMHVSGNTYRVQLDAIGADKFASVYNNNCGVNQSDGAGIYFGGDNAGNWVITEDRAYIDFTTAKETSVPTGFYGNYFCFNKVGGGLIEISNFNPSDVDWTATCAPAVADTEKPVMVNATLSSVAWNKAVITVEATDNVAVTKYHVVNTTPAVDVELAPKDGKITVTDLTAETTYNFTITAKDAAGNESENSKSVEATTEANTSEPTTAAPTPAARDAKWYRSLYSDTYTSCLTHGFALSNWGSIAGEEKVIGENHYLLYDASKGTNVIWGNNSDDANSIVAQEAYRGSGTGVDASSMEYMHVDIWSKVAINGVKVLVNDDHLRTINLTDEGWQSFDIELANPVQAVNLANIRWFKIVDITGDDKGNIAFDNIYFWREPVIGDLTAPTDVTPSFVESDLRTITLSVTATEDNDDISYSVKLGGEQVAVGSGKSGVAHTITVSGLEAGTDYEFQVIAKDAAGNAADPVNVSGSTKALPASAPAPVEAAENVKSLYSDAYTPVVTVANYREWWWQSPSVTPLVIGETDNVLYYDQNYTAGASFGWAWSADNKADIEDCKKLHLSIYPFKEGTIEVYPVVAPEADFHKTSGTLEANKWNDIVLDYTENTFAPFNQLGFVNFTNLGSYFVDNVYFFKEGTTTAIDNTVEAVKVQKMIENGQLIIIKNGIRYNVAGQMVK